MVEIGLILERSENESRQMSTEDCERSYNLNMKRTKLGRVRFNFQLVLVMLT